jgi:hypothetical protein
MRVEEEGGCKGAKTAEVINSERDESNVLGVKGRNSVVALRGVRGATLEFRVKNASQVSPED